MQVKFSILIPSFNRPNYIEESVLSCISNQTSSVEIIVSDDASPRRHEIESKLKKYIENGTIQYISSDTNQGWSQNRNRLIEKSNGEWIIIMGDDDRIKVGAIERLNFWIKKNPNIMIHAFGYDVIDEEGQFVYSRRSCSPKQYSISGGRGWEEIFYFDALPMWSHHPFTICCKRSIALKTMYKKEAGIADDVLFLLSVLGHGEIVSVVPESLIDWRRSIKKQCEYRSLSGDNERNRKSMLCVFRLLLNDQNLDPRAKELLKTKQFIGRFLGLSPDGAKLMQKEVFSGVCDKSQDTLEVLMEKYPLRPSILKINKLIRVCRVLGLNHVLSVLRWYLDMQHYKKIQRQGCSS